MLTSRGWWFLVFVLVLLGLGLRFDIATLALLGLTLLAWFLWEWLLFALRARLVVRNLSVQREVHDERGPVDSLWAGHTFQVRVRLELDSLLPLSYTRVADRLPAGVTLAGGAT